MSNLRLYIYDETIEMIKHHHAFGDVIKYAKATEDYPALDERKISDIYQIDLIDASDDMSYLVVRNILKGLVFYEPMSKTYRLMLENDISVDDFANIMLNFEMTPVTVEMTEHLPKYAHLLLASYLDRYDMVYSVK